MDNKQTGNPQALRLWQRDWRPRVMDVAFAVSWRGPLADEPVLLFIGADVELLSGVMRWIVGGGYAAGGFEIRREHAPIHRNGTVFWRLAVRFIDRREHFAGNGELAALVEARIRAEGHRCRYYESLEEFLNLKNNEENMATIYLRMPSYVAAFFRGRNEDNKLTEWDPYVFPPYSTEYKILQHGLRLIPEENQSAQCYGQRAWNNIASGLSADGTEKVINRSRREWPTIQEICALTKKPASPKLLSTDYLCIRMPEEVVIGDRIYVSNESYALPKLVAERLASLMREDFQQILVEWVQEEEANCKSLGIRRTRLEIIERFLTRFDVPVSISQKERESLRRQVNRWIDRQRPGRMNRYGFGDEPFLYHISEDDWEKKARKERKERRAKKG